MRPGEHDPSSAHRPAEWGDWRWQLRHAVGSAEELYEALSLSAGELEGARRAEAQGLPLRITPYYLSLVDRHDPACPIRRQCVPDAAEAHTVTGDLVDPLGEVAHEVAPHLIQRYPDRHFTVIILTNRNGGDPATIAERVTDQLLLHP